MVWFDEVVPSLKKVNGMRMYPKIFATVHASTHEPGQGVADSKIKSFYVCSVDFATGIDTKGFHNFHGISKYDTLEDFYNFTPFFLLAHLCVFQVRIRNEHR
jgi:hypothetical protein